MAVATPDLGRELEIVAAAQKLNSSFFPKKFVSCVVIVNQNTNILHDKQHNLCIFLTAKNIKERMEWKSHFSRGERLLCFLHYKVSFPQDRERESGCGVCGPKTTMMCFKKTVSPLDLGFKHYC